VRSLRTTSTELIVSASVSSSASACSWMTGYLGGQRLRGRYRRRKVPAPDDQMQGAKRLKHGGRMTH